MTLQGAEVVAAKQAIRRRHGCDSYYVGSYDREKPTGAPVVHEFVLDDPDSTAYVWFVETEVRIVLKGPDVPSPWAAAISAHASS
jgi:hypothetical protein